MEKLLNKLRNRKGKKGKACTHSPNHTSPDLASCIQTNLDDIKLLFDKSSDIVIRTFKIRDECSTEAAIVYVDGLIAQKVINESAMKSLMLQSYSSVSNDERAQKNVFETIKEHFLTISDVKEVKDMDEVVDQILSGDTILFVDGSPIALSLSTKGWENRGVTEPDSESVIRGPREGFSETLRTNTALLRRKIKDRHLIIEAIKIGKITRTDVAIAYVEGIASGDIIAKVKKRLDQIDVDSILESGYIEELIEDAPFSLFPTIANTQKPDVVAGKLLEGRVALFVDGTPHVLTMPAVFMEYLQTSEDYYSNPFYVTAMRWIRMLAFLSSAFLPSFYVAITSYHAVMIPVPMLLTIASSREGVPFPSIVEALLMGVIFEGLREAGVRMPRPVGPAVSIVGALVIGDAAIAAGLASAGMVIIVGITAIASFIIPNAEIANALVPIRLLMIIPAGILGLYGLILAMIILAAHLVTLESFGVPYLYPIAPLSVRGLKDTIVKTPQWAMSNRPHVLGSEITTQQNHNKDHKR